MLREILSIRKLKAKRLMALINQGVDDAKPIPRMPTESKRKPPVNGMRLSYRETNQPEKGNPSNELIGMKSRMVPNSASL